MYRGVGSGMVVPYFLVLQAELVARNGDPDGALSLLADARDVMRRGETFPAAEIDRLEGEFRRLARRPRRRD